jgi:hypothetical protein
MKEDKPLVDRDYLLDKSPGMGGWVYTIIPEVAPDPHAPFGWVRVRGTIDGVEIRDYHLMPATHGSGQLFLSVKAGLRKKLGKREGDTVHIVLWRDDEPREVPGDLLLCLADDGEAERFFNSLTEAQRHQYVRWINAAKNDETRVERMAKTVAALAQNRKFSDLTKIKQL